MSLARILSRAVLIIVCSIAGYVLNTQLDLIKPHLLGLFMGLGLAVFVLMVEVIIKEFSIKLIIGGTMGLVIGLGIAFLISYPLGRFMDSVPVAVSVYVITACMFGYIGVTLGSGKIGELRSEGISFLEREEEEPGADASEKLLDTSALIDGRIAEVVGTGFVEGRLVVPRFVLNELQAVADSSDPLRRQRGRRGMEVLAELQDRDRPEVAIVDDQAEGPVDQQLVLVARERGAAIITTDYNLNKVAQLQGVKVLNVNELAQVVRTVLLPGERFQVRIIKEGKSQGQGVGYLDDGTMVVVENASHQIGQTAQVAVTSVLQTPAGRMIFTEMTGDEGRHSGSDEV